MRRSRDPQIGIDEDAAERVALSGQLCGQGRSTHACRPDHRVGFDPRAIVERDTAFVEAGNAGSDDRLDTELAQPCLDIRTRLVTHVAGDTRSEEHTSELQSLMRISYAV